MGVEALAHRWLAFHGVADPDGAVHRAVARAGRLPPPMGSAWSPALGLVEGMAPALLLGQVRRASGLDDDAFDSLERSLHAHPSPWVRLMWLLARSPLMAQAHEDAGPVDPAPHPLRAPALAERIRRGAHLRNDRFDVAVVGSGAGGAPVAWALARAGLRVVVVEAGEVVTPTSAPAAVERYYANQGFVGAVSRGAATIILAGRAVGGTTPINSGTSLRPRSERLAAWDAEAGTRFAEGDLDRHLDAAARQMGVGPVPESLLDASARVVRAGLRRLGDPGWFPLYRNAPTCTGQGRCCFGCPTGAKRGTDRAWLPEAVEAGAVLLWGTEAIGVVPHSDHVDLWVRTPTERRRLRVGHLVLSAGALETPALIRGQRLGSAWRVAGNGLRIHPATKVLALMPEALTPGGVPQGMGYRTDALPRLTFEGARTPAPLTGLILAAGGRRHRWWMARHDRLANLGMMTRDRATGSVRKIVGQNVIRYRLHPDDARDLGRGLRRAAEVLFAGGAERVLLPVVGPDPEVARPADLAALRPEALAPERLFVSGFHPHATAAVGRVVDGDLRLRGAPRISVCDASVLPGSPGVNPQLTIMALSLRLAERLLEEH